MGGEKPPEIHSATILPFRGAKKERQRRVDEAPKEPVPAEGAQVIEFKKTQKNKRIAATDGFVTWKPTRVERRKPAPSVELRGPEENPPPSSEIPKASPEMLRYSRALSEQQIANEAGHAAKEKAHQESELARVEREAAVEAERQRQVVELKEYLKTSKPFSYTDEIYELPLRLVKQCIGRLQGAYQQFEYPWLIPTLVSEVIVHIHEKTATPSYVKRRESPKTPVKLELIIGLNSSEEELCRLMHDALQPIADKAGSRESAAKMVLALTDFLESTYRTRIEFELGADRSRWNTLVAECVKNIYEAFRLLRPEEVKRLSEINFQTPRDTFVLRVIERIGSAIDRIFSSDQEHEIYIGFTTLPREIAGDIRLYIRKHPKQ